MPLLFGSIYFTPSVRCCKLGCFFKLTPCVLSAAHFLLSCQMSSCLFITLQEMLALFPSVLKLMLISQNRGSNLGVWLALPAIPWCPRLCGSCHRHCRMARVYSFFRLKPFDEEACCIITGSSTATRCEIHVTRAAGKLNMPQRGLNIPSFYMCNLIWRVCHNAFPVREEIIHRDRMDKGQSRTSPLFYTVTPSENKKHFFRWISFSFWF